MANVCSSVGALRVLSACALLLSLGGFETPDSQRTTGGPTDLGFRIASVLLFVRVTLQSRQPLDSKFALCPFLVLQLQLHTRA